MSVKSLLKKRFVKGAGELENIQVLRFSGVDCQSFLQGQITSDLTKLDEKQFQLSARLNRSGRVVAFFYLLKNEDSFHVIVANDMASVLKEDLEKFIIMEDVKLEITSLKAFYYLGPDLGKIKEKIDFVGHLYGEKGLIRLSPFDSSLPILDSNEIKTVSIINGFPELNINISINDIINYSRLNEFAVNYKKGCFLGQETAAKLESRRDVVYYPVLIESKKDVVTPMALTLDGKKVGDAYRSVFHEDMYYIEARLHRDYRLEAMEQYFDQMSGKVYNYPLLGRGSDKAKAEDIFYDAVDAFNKNEDEKAISQLDEALELYSLPDAYESKGVILGRNGDYQGAIALMDKLLEVDPSSIMAHTNKSLYLMKMGKIEEAEAEKDKATLKSFSKASNEAKEKKENEQAIKRREEMFKQVLELDPEDLLASYGMADISFNRGEFQEAVNLTEKIITHHPKHGQAYLLYSKALIATNNKAKAKEVLETGLKVAKNNGDLKCLQEMNYLLVDLK
jgi:folate-binding Fe-S cluster repair protein YgfZ/Flp pilus assembly protein TadD